MGGIVLGFGIPWAYHHLRFGEELPKDMDSYELLVIWILLAIGFGVVVVLGPFTAMHYRNLLRNLTTIEVSEQKRIMRQRIDACEQGYFKDTTHNPYDLGISNNFRQVFGNRIILWFLPIYSSLGDGVTYPLAKY